MFRYFSISQPFCYSDIFMNHKGTKSTKKALKSSVLASGALQSSGPLADLLAFIFVGSQLLPQRILLIPLRALCAFVVSRSAVVLRWYGNESVWIQKLSHAEARRVSIAPTPFRWHCSSRGRLQGIAAEHCWASQQWHPAF
jgi:hypothetical protein